MPSEIAELRARLPGLMLRDQRRLGRRVGQAAGLREPAARERALRRVADDMDQAQARIEARRRAVPELSYPPELPVSQLKDQIAEVIRDHQVVIVAGETGSGKTTQLPKICLELGRGVAGQIGHTQPRRIAARTVAERIAEELGTEIGAAVGYKVRFTDTASDAALVKVMTDGILLTEMQRDRQLLRYDTLIIDEAHERSLNIDFILGYLKQLLPSRPDLKVIITSATIDPDRFSKHFGDAPVIEVSGRTYPVEVRYRPLADPDEPGDEPQDQIQGILDAVAELRRDGPGDILVFLSGEREIRDTADALSDADGLEVLPLYARLSAAEQHRVFQAALTAARVVLATNVAETSLTVPGIQLRDRSRHRADLPVQPPDQGAAAADRADLAGVGQPAHRPLRPDRRRHLHPALQPRTTSPPGPSSPSRRSCGPTWPRSSCGWPTWTWARSRTSRSSTRRTRATSRTASGCCTNWARLPRRARPPAAHRRRPQAGPPAAGSAARSHDHRGRAARLRARGADHRGRRCPSWTRGSGPPTRGRRPTPSMPGSPSPARTSWPS